MVLSGPKERSRIDKAVYAGAYILGNLWSHCFFMGSRILAEKSSVDQKISIKLSSAFFLIEALLLVKPLSMMAWIISGCLVFSSFGSTFWRKGARASSAASCFRGWASDRYVLNNPIYEANHPSAELSAAAANSLPRSRSAFTFVIWVLLFNLYSSGLPASGSTSASAYLANSASSCAAKSPPPPKACSGYSLYSVIYGTAFSSTIYSGLTSYGSSTLTSSGFDL